MCSWVNDVTLLELSWQIKINTHIAINILQRQKKSVFFYLLYIS